MTHNIAPGFTKRRAIRLTRSVCLATACALVASLLALVVDRSAGAAPTNGAPAFAWATAPLSTASALLDGSPNGDLLASSGSVGNADGSLASPLVSLWDTASGTRTGPPASIYTSAGETVAAANGSGAFFSGSAAGSGRCNPVFLARDGTTTELLPGETLYQAGPPCTMIRTGDGNQVLVGVDTSDPERTADVGWYVLDSHGNRRRVTNLDRTGPFGGMPCAPTLSPNGIDVLVSRNGVCSSAPEADLGIVHLDGRPPTPVAAPPGYHVTGLPLASYLDGSPRTTTVDALQGQWTSDGTHFAMLVTQDATCSDSILTPPCITRLAILSIDGSMVLVGPADQAVLTNWFSSGEQFSSSAQSAPVMSRDGTHIAYLTSGTGGLSLWVSAIDGSADHQAAAVMSDVAEIKRAGDNFAVLTYTSVHTGESLYWTAGDGSSVRTILSGSTTYDLWSIQVATPDSVYVYGWDTLNPASPARTDTIYAVSLIDGATPTRLIPYSETLGNVWVTGVSLDGSRVSGWAQSPDGRIYRGYTVSVARPSPSPAGHLEVSPRFAKPGARVTASWTCAVDQAARLSVLDTRGIVAWSVRPPTSSNGMTWTVNFVAFGKPGTYTVIAKCDGLPVDQARLVLLSSKYVALGDSYASGEGASKFLPGTDEGPGGNMCHRAEHGWAVQVQELTRDSFDFAACSGAVISDLYNTNSTSGEIPQLWHLSNATRLITISIGGNDIGFPGVLKDCVFDTFGAPGFGRPGCSVRERARVNRAISWLANGRPDGCHPFPGAPVNGRTPEACGAAPSLADLYRDIHANAPHAKIIVVAYPRLWGSKFSKLQVCRLGTAGGVDEAYVSRADATWMNSAGLALNGAIASSVDTVASEGVNVVLAPVDQQFVQHRLCDTRAPWIHALDFSLAANGSYDQRSFHPKDSGQSAQFSGIRRRL